MSSSALAELLEGVDFVEPRIIALDYSAHARRLLLRIADRDGNGAASRIRALVFDGLVGLHSAPDNALAPLEEGETTDLLRLDAKQRKTGDIEITLVFLRDGVAQHASFQTHGARWLG